MVVIKISSPRQVFVSNCLEPKVFSESSKLKREALVVAISINVTRGSLLSMHHDVNPFMVYGEYQLVTTEKIALTNNLLTFGNFMQLFTNIM